MATAEYQGMDREASSAQVRREAKPEVRDPAALMAPAAGNVSPGEEYREAWRGSIGSKAKPEVQDSETLRARIAQELKMVERLQSTVRPLALIVIVLFGLLVALQLYTWMRLEELTSMGQQREERAALAQATLKEDIERQRAALDQAAQQMASLSQAHPKTVSPVRESEEHRTASAFYERPKHTKASKEPRLEHLSAPSSGTGQPVAGPDPPAAAREVSSRDLSAMRQASTVIYQNPSAIRRDPPANRQGSSPPSTSQALPTRQGPDAIQNEQHENAESWGMKLSQQPDTDIAHDHNEVEKLRKLGKRDYVEFTLVRSGTRQEVAPDISLELRKVDSKRSRCALDIYAEGYEFPTNLAINEPIVFPIRAMWESVDLVINKMGKDTVVGYISARKGLLVAGR